MNNNAVKGVITTLQGLSEFVGLNSSLLSYSYFKSITRTRIFIIIMTIIIMTEKSAK